MRKRIQLNIPEPCHESWDQMKPVDKARPDDPVGRGRFCGSCQKQVVDFTTMNDSQLIAFFRKPSTGSVCGRFMQDQLGRTIDIPRKQIPWVKYFFQFLLPGFLMSCGARTVGRIKINESKNEVVTKLTQSQTTGMILMELEKTVLPDTIEGAVVVNDFQSIKGELLIGDTNVLAIPVQGEISDVYELPGPINIKGNVIDDNDQPVPYASVFIKGTTIGVATDSAGNFSLKYPGKGESIVLLSSCIGFQNTESIVSLNKSEHPVTISLASSNTLEGVVVFSYPPEVKEELIFTGGITVERELNIIDTICNKVFPSKQSLKLYPNPLKRNTSLTIETSKHEKGTYLFQLTALNGQVVLSKEKWMDKNDRVIQIDIPSIAAGTYLVSMIDKQSGKSITGKIIVE